MSKLITQFTMSLDGFVANTSDDVGDIFRWYGSGDVPHTLPGLDRTFHISAESAKLLNQQWPRLGAVLTGRRDFDVSNAWGGQALLGIPTFILTHEPPKEWVYDGSPFTFVTDFDSAIEQAIVAAGDRDVGVSGTKVVQQCLRAGLLDEIHIDLAPVLLGRGIALFDAIDVAPIHLDFIETVIGKGVVHHRFRVQKPDKTS